MTDFHELYNRYASDIYRFALSLCGDAEEAEDITAETFARALTGKAPIVSATVKGYLLTIARNLHLESVRRRKRLSELPLEVPDSSPNFELVSSHKAELEAVQAYLQTIPEVDRAALVNRPRPSWGGSIRAKGESGHWLPLVSNFCCGFEIVSDSRAQYQSGTLRAVIL